MSVLLTAGKNSVKAKPKSAKPKKKKSPSGSTFSSSPPLSSEKTAVWHWQFYQDMVTIMFNKENLEVWCNGEVLETVDGFAQTGCGDGGVLDFYITLEDDSSHRGRIQRVSAGKAGMGYQLYVDGYQILERTTYDQNMQYVPPIPTGMQYMSGAPYIPDAAVYQEPPPGYDQVMMEEHKKSK